MVSKNVWATVAPRAHASGLLFFNIFYFCFTEQTDGTDTEIPTYDAGRFLADVGGSAGLIFGLNIMDT